MVDFSDEPPISAFNRPVSGQNLLAAVVQACCRTALPIPCCNCARQVFSADYRLGLRLSRASVTPFVQIGNRFTISTNKERFGTWAFARPFFYEGDRKARDLPANKSNSFFLDRSGSGAPQFHPAFHFQSRKNAALVWPCLRPLELTRFLHNLSCLQAISGRPADP